MKTYTVEYHWDFRYQLPMLQVQLSGTLLNSQHTLPQMIDNVHAVIQRSDHDAVYLLYDFSSTERRLPLASLMQRTRVSPKVKRVAIVGTRARVDEMSVLIMRSAKQIPYDYGFFNTIDESVLFFNQHAPA